MLSWRNVNHRKKFPYTSISNDSDILISLIYIAFFQQCNSLSLKKKLTIKIHFYIRVTPINALAGLSLSN